MIPNNLKSRPINQMVWNFNTEAEILALGQYAMHLNISYTSGLVRYKCVEAADGTKSLVKDTDGALTNVTSGDGTKVTKTGSTVKVEVNVLGDTKQAATIKNGALFVPKVEVDADSANLAEFVEDATGVQKLKILRAGRRGAYIRTALADMAAFVASSEYIDANGVKLLTPGDTLMFVNSADAADAGFNQVRFSYECVAQNGDINDFIEHEKDAAETPYTSDSTVVTLNPISRKINHNFSTAARSALKVNGAGAAEVIVGDATVTSYDGVADISVQAYFDLLKQADVDMSADIDSITNRVNTLETRTYTQGVVLDGSEIKVGGDITETRTTTIQAGAVEYSASATGVGTMMSVQPNKIVFGHNTVNQIGKGRWWVDNTTGKYYQIDFDVFTGAEYLAQVSTGLPNL